MAISVLTIVGLLLLMILMISLAQAVDLEEFKYHVKRPKGIIIGFICQSIFLPAFSFGMTQAFNMDPAMAVALILTAASPGGILSNFFCFLIGADLSLSIAMTTCSTLLAVATMPANMAIWVPPLNISSEVQVDLVSIVVSALVIFVAVLIGLYLSTKEWPRIKGTIGVLGSLSLIVLVFLGIRMNIQGSKPIHQLDYTAWIPCLILTIAGWFVGLVLSLVTKMPKPSAVAVGIETSNQQTGTALTVITVALTGDPRDRALAIPLIYTLLTWGVNLILVFVFAYLGWTDAEESETITCGKLISRAMQYREAKKNNFADEKHKTYQARSSKDIELGDGTTNDEETDLYTSSGEKLNNNPNPESLPNVTAVHDPDLQYVD